MDKDREPWVRDETWMEKVVQKDEKALQVLYARFAPLLHHVSMKSLDKGAAEDIVQEVFFIVWTKSGDFDPAKGSLRNWILQIAHFRILNELRRRSRRPALEFEDMDIIAGGIGSQAEPPEETWKSFRVDALQDAIDRLPAAQRQALRLAFFDELSHEEVADALGLPLGTVKGRIRLALRNLRGRLIPVALGVLLAWGAGAAVWTYVSTRSAAANVGALAFLTRADITVKKLSAFDGKVTGTCSYDTEKGMVVLGLQGLERPADGKAYRLWARWGETWTAVGDLAWEGDGRGLLRVRDSRWNQEPRSIEVTEEGAGVGAGPSGRVIVGTDL
jgi:RNA polymerase sigma factor (sigma-70 family)